MNASLQFFVQYTGIGERCTEVNLRRYQPLSRKTFYLREFFSTIGWIEENERRDDPSNDAHP